MDAWASWRRLLVLAALLAGLFAMHGLADHGAAHPAAATAGTSSPAASDHDGHAGLAAALPQGAEAIVAPSNGQHPMALAGLCLAVLALLLLRVSRPGRGVLEVTAHRAVRRLAVLPRRARERDPPCHVALSVQRC